MSTAVLAGAVSESRRDAGAPDIEIETLPGSRGGQDLLGTRFPEVEFDRWIRGAPEQETEPQPESGHGPKVTLYRWWTDRCPYCEASLPAIERLRQRYEDDGLRVVAVYHPKPPREVEDGAVAAAAEARGFHGAVALDRDWSVLKRFYLDTGRRSATSASFLVDSDGVIRFVHPGPVFFPSDDPRFRRENDDYKSIQRAIRRLVANGDRDR